MIDDEVGDLDASSKDKVSKILQEPVNPTVVRRVPRDPQERSTRELDIDPRYTEGGHGPQRTFRNGYANG